jgi:hypothetical protein
MLGPCFLRGTSKRAAQRREPNKCTLQAAGGQADSVAAGPRRDRALALSPEPAPTPPEGHPPWIIGWQWP